MQASIVDLRYKMKDVLKALDRNETVKILYHGKTKGLLVPVTQKVLSKKVEEHPFFGMHAKQKESVEAQMERLRGGRYKDI